jgi:hypothetical protein
MQTGVVQEDVDALNILQVRALSDIEPTEVSVKIDRGGLAARRMLSSMIDNETSGASLRTAH